MSRIGNQILSIPSGVEVNVNNQVVNVKGSKGSLDLKVNSDLSVVVEDGNVKVTRSNENKFTKSIHGTTTALIKNMLVGVSEGFSKELELNGVGYRVQVSGKKLL